MLKRIHLLLSALLAIPLSTTGDSPPKNLTPTNVPPLPTAQTALAKGNYETAEKSFAKRLESGKSDAVKQRAAAGLLKTLLATGQYESAIKTGNSLLENHPDWDETAATVGTSLTALGRYAEARNVLAKILKRNPRSAAATIAMIELANLTGDRREQRLRRKLWSRWYRRGEVNDADDLIATAAAVADVDPKSAWRIYHEALDADPNALEAGVRAGFLAFERQAWPKAKRLFNTVLKVNPHHPLAMCGLATVAMAEIELAKADHLLKQALTINPNLTTARRLLAQSALMSRDVEKAKQELEKASAVNPDHPETLALMAALHDRSDHASQRDELLKQALAINPTYSMAYNLLALIAARHHQPQRAVDWTDKAIKINPDDWLAHYQRGISLCRLGEEKPGHAALERAFELNPYNIWAYNMLQVMDRDVKKHQFVVHDTDHFAIKTDKTESDAFRRELGELLERNHAKYTDKYQVVPKGPAEHGGRLLVLVLPSHEEFAARTLGLPGMTGIAGVCFGQLINMPSPNTVLAQLVKASREEMEKNEEPDSKNDKKKSLKSRGPDWRTVAVHEFLHVLTLQKTHYQIPRWFTEGISTFEEPEPNQHDMMKTLVASLLEKDMLLPVEKLEAGFIRPTFPLQVIASYMQSALICEYIIEKHGFPTILKLLDLYSKNEDTATAIPKATGLSLETFNQQAKEFIGEKVAPFKQSENNSSTKKATTSPSHDE